MARQNIQHLFAIFNAAAGRNHMTEHDLLALIVHLVVVEKSAALARFAQWSNP